MLVLCACGSNPKQATHSGDLVPTVSLDSDVSIETGTPTDSADPVPPVDNDGDGYSAEEDCDDTDPSRYPGAPELCDDGVVSDCTLSELRALDLCRVASVDRAVAAWEPTPSELHSARGRGIGDTNSDGWLEVAIGTPHLDADLSATGGLIIFDGDWSGEWAAGTEPTVVQGSEYWDSIGTDLLPIGDVDHDGFDDLVVGAPDDPYNSPSGTPAVYFLYGPLSGDSFARPTEYVENPFTSECLGAVLEAIPAIDGTSPPMIAASGQCKATVRLFQSGLERNLSPTDDAAAVLHGPTPDRTSGFGHALEAADFDADGLADLVVSSPEHGQSAPRSAMGFVSLFAGPIAGETTYSDAHASITAQDGDSAPHGDSGVHVLLFGSGLASDDLDGDGYADLVVGAPIQNSTTSDRLEGAIHVFHGPLTGELGLTAASLTIYGDGENDGLGGSLEADKDLNGDGVNDLLVGNAYLEINGTGFTTMGSSCARAWLFHGPLPTGSMDASDFDAAYEWPDVRQFGSQVTSVGDLDGDGTHEVLVGNLGNHFLLFTQPSF